MSLRFDGDRVARKSPIRLVCAPPSWQKSKSGSKQAWGYLFDDPAEPYRNFAECRWVCSRDIRAASFRQASDSRRHAVLHPSTKPAGKGAMFRRFDDVRLSVVSDPRVKASGGWQLSFFDELGAAGDVWGSSADDALKRAFGKEGFHSAYDARDWRLESVVDASGKVYGAEP